MSGEKKLNSVAGLRLAAKVKVKQLIDTYSPTAEEEKMIVEVEQQRMILRDPSQLHLVPFRADQIDVSRIESINCLDFHGSVGGYRFLEFFFFFFF